MTERVLPSFRGDPVPVVAGENLTEPLRFELLTVGNDPSGGAEFRVPARRPALLLVFSSRCPACYANLPAWRRTLERAGGKASVVAVGLERSQAAVAAYAAQNLPGAAAAVPSRPDRFTKTLGIRIVPYTALVDTAGTLLFSRQGSLDSLAVATLEQALGALTGRSTP